jgi:hypothetical protein
VGCLLQEEDRYMEQNGTSRREFVKRAVYVAPAILTLQAMPAYVKAGSVKDDKKGKKIKIKTNR